MDLQITILSFLGVLFNGAGVGCTGSFGNPHCSSSPGPIGTPWTGEGMGWSLSGEV